MGSATHGSVLSLARDADTGRRLGKYEVLCRLSEGGMSTLFLAMAKGAAGFRKLVVLKRVLPAMASEPDSVDRFLDEARVMAGFSHPHIAQVFDLDQEGPDFFLAMEFVTGASLLELVNACLEEDDVLPLGFALAAARDVALALHYAHTYVDPTGRPRRIIHRDVAPKNVMVTYEGVTKLLDFGVAKAEGSDLTRSGMVIGTPGYMAPEQSVGKTLDGRTDIFALGVTLFESMTGKRLYGRATPDAEMRAPFEGPPPRPSQLNKRIPLRLDAVVLKALAKAKEDRYANALELAKAIESAGGELVWPFDKRAELVQRLFKQRREQTRRLLQAVQDAQDATVLNFPAISTPAKPDVTEDFIPQFDDPAIAQQPTKPGRGQQAPAEEPKTQHGARSRWRWLWWALVPGAVIGAVVALAKLLPAQQSTHAARVERAADAGRQ
jgi:serine/threonine protein kinase